MLGASSGAGALGPPRFSQEMAGSLLFEGSVFSTSPDLGFLLFGPWASCSAVVGFCFDGRLFSFPRGGFCFVFAPPSADVAFALALAAGMASSAAARFKRSERFWS